MKVAFKMMIATFVMFAFCIAKTWGQYPGSGQQPLDPNLIPKYVDFLPHFAGLRVNAKAGGNLIIEAVKTQQVAVSTGTVLDNGIVGTTSGAGVGNYFVYRISKDNGKTWTLPLWPSFTIEAQRGNKLDVELRNKLRDYNTGKDFTYKDVNIAADQTILMSGVPLTGDPMTEPYTGPIPIALHLHGGEVQSTSDGGPYAWFTPEYELTGKGWLSGNKGGVTKILHYPNTQEAATIWYHEHSQLGLTRVNVYAGMAGFYFLRGDDEERDRLPGWFGDDLVQEVTPAGKTADALHPGPYLPEIEIAIQDRMFDTKGQLFYTVEPTSPSIHPFWTPEFFGNVITVNGKTWPYLSVAPRKYRFHFLDGSNARFYNVWLQNLASGAMGPAITQIGTDGGLLDTPATFAPGEKLLMAPGERFDVVIDFSKVRPGSVLTLMNDANGPYPTGDPVTVGTTDHIMQFVVNGRMVDNKDYNDNHNNYDNKNSRNYDRNHHYKDGQDQSNVPHNLRSKPMVKLTNFAGQVNDKPDVTRQLVLNEVEGDGGPVMVLVNNSRFEDMPEMGMFGKVTEKPVEGTTEKWQIINTTMDAHPMHMHLVQFQLVSRQNYDVMAYMDKYMNSFSGVNGGMPSMLNMYMGAEGPPYKYDVKNSDGAVGGNPSIKHYLMGPVIPAPPNERGWKDVIKAYPNQITTYMVRFAPTDLPLNTPKNKLIYGFDPSKGPGYVWHCHIVEHEDNDMMRPMEIIASPYRWFKSGSLGDSIIASPVNGTTEGFALYQNSPNPFDDYTDIRFTLGKDCHVELLLFNSMGAKIKTLINADAPAGDHIATLYSDNNLPAGVYFYQLKTPAFAETKKLVVFRKK